MLQHRQGHHEGPLSGEYGLIALALAHGFDDNHTGQLEVGSFATILASVTVTPKVSGKFHVTLTCLLTNDTEDDGDVIIGVAHNLTTDYTQGSGVSVFGSSRVSNALTVEYGSGPLAGVVFPVGAPVTIDFIGIATIGGIFLAQPHDAQITVEELPN
jgi:hypothetical protein